MMLRKIVSCLLLASTCASAALANPAPSPPPYEGIYQPRGVDEVGFWREDDESERRLAASPLVIRDEKLTKYLKEVLCNSVGTDRCNSARIYVLREPTFNATMSPNGTMRIFSGLLLRMRSEAELAYILGHEFGHFERRHGLDRFKATRRGTDILAWGMLLASMSPSYDTRRTYQSLEISIYGNLFRYGRDHERESDLLGLGYLNNSSLRPQAASEVWQNVIGEIEASSTSRGLKKPRFDAVAFTASHPPQGERAGYLAALAEPTAAERDDGALRYREALSTWLPVFLQDQIKLNDFGGSEYIIANLAQSGWTPNLWLARAELYRTRGNQRDLVNAVQFYSNAIAMDANLPDAYRGLGLSLVKTGEQSQGQAALSKYLALKPDADDAKMITLMLPKETSQ